MAEDVLQRIPAADSGTPGRSALLTVGGVALRVSASAYDSLRRQTRYRWPALDRLARRPLRQFTGPGDDEIEVQGLIFPAAGGDAAAPAALRALAAAGEPVLVSTGYGDVLGRWAVLSIEEEQSRPHADGAPRRIAWTLMLAHAGEDDTGAAAHAPAHRAADAGDPRGTLTAVDAAAEAGDDAAGVQAAAGAA